MTDETIQVGDRVRLKGDHSPHPLWMTVTRKDMNPIGPSGQAIQGTFLQLMWPYSTNGVIVQAARNGDLDDVRSVQSVMEGAVTTREHEPSPDELVYIRPRGATTS